MRLTVVLGVGVRELLGNGEAVGVGVGIGVGCWTGALRVAKNRIAPMRIRIRIPSKSGKFEEFGVRGCARIYVRS